eukprot:2315294-Pleurochrysis_carterae.AAC.1
MSLRNCVSLLHGVGSLGWRPRRLYYAKQTKTCHPQLVQPFKELRERRKPCAYNERKTVAKSGVYKHVYLCVS